MVVVISQSMYFPWVGLLEQVKLADVFVHYDDVEFVRGFFNRVQVKTQHGTPWLTVPTLNRHRGQKIDEILIDETQDWRRKHRDVLRSGYSKAPYKQEMLDVVNSVFNKPCKYLSDISRYSLTSMIEYFGLRSDRTFLDSKCLGVGGKSSERLLGIVLKVGGKIYLTGHGAKNYLDHELFERAGISVRYINYQCMPYPQLHGPFAPYVSGLDRIANCGKEGASVITSPTIDWREFLDETA